MIAARCVSTVKDRAARICEAPHHESSPTVCYVLDIFISLRRLDPQAALSTRRGSHFSGGSLPAATFPATCVRDVQSTRCQRLIRTQTPPGSRFEVASGQHFASSRFRADDRLHLTTCEVPVPVRPRFWDQPGQRLLPPRPVPATDLVLVRRIEAVEEAMARHGKPNVFKRRSGQPVHVHRLSSRC